MSKYNWIAATIALLERDLAEAIKTNYFCKPNPTLIDAYIEADYRLEHAEHILLVDAIEEHSK
tara:strand:+ start:26 stop:214 length:189 start_codon:yes stop_codon:yes gene_type:complete